MIGVLSKLVNKTYCSIPTLHERSKLVDQSSDKALVLNNYFHSCFSTLQPPLVGIIDRLEPANCPSNINKVDKNEESYGLNIN